MQIEATLDANEKGEAFLNFNLPFGLPRRLDFLEGRWILTPEPRLMLVGCDHDLVGQLQEKMSCSLSGVQQEARELLLQAGAGIGFAINPDPRISLVSRHYGGTTPHKRTVLVFWCYAVTGADRFYRKLEKAGIAINQQPPLYVTLYAKDDPHSGQGVELCTPLDVMKFTQEIVPAVLPPMVIECWRELQRDE